MKRYTIFDCTTLSTDTDAVIFGPRVVAVAFAKLRSCLTGRFHDYMPTDGHFDQSKLGLRRSGFAFRMGR